MKKIIYLRFYSFIIFQATENLMIFLMKNLNKYLLIFCRETKWKYLMKMRIFNNCTNALDAYSNTPCPASQFIEKLKLKREFSNKIEKMKQNFKSETLT